MGKRAKETGKSIPSSFRTWDGCLKKKKKSQINLKIKDLDMEHPKLYGRTCSICHRRITKLSDLELDHTKPYSKGGKKLALAHRDCNRMKSSGSLRKIQKTLGIKTSKGKRKKKKKTTKRRRKRQHILEFPTLRI